MSLLDLPYMKPDAELRAIIEEYEATGGRMYQNRNLDRATAQLHKQPMRPKYYGRKTTNSLQRMRAQKLITQEELAAKSGTTKRTVGAIENNRREPSVILALALAQALDVKVEDIFHLPYLTPVPPSKH